MPTMSSPSPEPPTLTERNTAIRLLDRYALDQFRGAKIDPTGLSPSMRGLVLLGYLVVITLVLLALLMERLGADLSTTSFVPSLQNTPHVIPVLALWVTLASYAIGWALLMTGAVFARRSLFIGVCLAFVALNIAGLSQDASAPDLAIAPIIGTPALALALRVVRAKAPALNPLLITLLFAVLIGLSVALWLGTTAPPNSATATHAAFVFLNVLAYPIWLMSGLSLIAFAISIARSVIARLRNSMSESSLTRLVTAVLIAHPLISGAAALVLMGSAIGATFAPVVAQDAVLSLPIGVIMLVLLARKRWTGPNAAMLLGVRIALFIFSLTYLILQSSGFNVADPVNGTLEKLALLPSSLFYMGGMALSLLGFFVPFANTETAKLSRTARILLALGCAILLVGMMFFLLNTVNDAGENLAGDSIFSTLFLLGVLLLGLPFLIFTALRRRENLVGTPAEWAQAAEQHHRPHLAAITFVLLIPLITVLCACSLFVGSFFFGMGKQ